VQSQNVVYRTSALGLYSSRPLTLQVWTRTKEWEPTRPTSTISRSRCLRNRLSTTRSSTSPRGGDGFISAPSPIALAAAIVLVSLADGLAAKVSSAVFGVSSLTLFGISAVYHRFHWSERTRDLLRRLDHANIFFLIAGTYTPIAALALPPAEGQLLLILVWSGAVGGILLRVLWLNAPRWLYVPLYLVLGWAAVMYTPQLVAANTAMLVLVFVGGGLYSLGAVVYGTKWPDPAPRSFGFHEIFHALTVGAFLCHWTAVLLISLNPAF